MKKWLIAAGVVVVLVIGIFAGSVIYANSQNKNAPAELGLSSQPSTSEVTASGSQSANSSDGTSTAPLASGTATSTDLDGSWNVAQGSQAGYRVQEVLNGQNVTVAGRTDLVTGSLTVASEKLTRAEITVDMTAVKTDDASRDNRFLDILKTGANPTSTFSLSSPLDISGLSSTPSSLKANGNLTIAGVSKAVTLSLNAQLTSSGVEISGSIPVKFSDYGVEAPNLGFVKVEDSGTVEMLLKLGK